MKLKSRFYNQEYVEVGTHYDFYLCSYAIFLFIMLMKQDKVDALLNVRCNLETKSWRVYDTYRRNYKRPLLASKIFSRHEAGAFDANPDVLAKLLVARDSPPTAKMEWPETENQWYGWFTAPLTDRDRKDPRMYFPRPSTEISKLGGLLLADESRHKKKK